MLQRKTNSKLYKSALIAVLILALALSIGCGAPAAGGSSGADGSNPSSANGSGAGESSDKITEERAKELSLSHAKISDADFIRVELDYDDGRKHWDVEFYKDGFEYDYEIDADSGEVLSFSKEREDDRQDATSQGGQQSADQNVPNEGKPELISEEQAKAKALEKAGVDAADAVFKKTELDRDDGRIHYELEFRVGKYEYECSVDAENGKVYDFEKDIDD